MDCTPKNVVTSSFAREEAPVFNVVTVYEDFETGRHARRTFEFLADNLGRDCNFNHQMWKFEVLKNPKLRRMAANDAADADIFLICCHGGEELPPQIMDWIDQWQAEPLHALALVALFVCAGDPRERTRSIRNYLAEVARKGRMEFFGQPDTLPAQQQPLPQPGSQHPPALAARTLFALMGAVHQDAVLPRWGLTE